VALAASQPSAPAPEARKHWMGVVEARPVTTAQRLSEIVARGVAGVGILVLTVVLDG